MTNLGDFPENLAEIWNEIENCTSPDCPLGGGEPLIFKPERNVNVMVITEGPNEYQEPEVVASLANHPTFTFLQAMFKGKFQPRGKQATVYWTHVRKCFLKRSRSKVNKEDRRKGREALRVCSEKYLLRELKALKPKLVIVVGNSAKKFFSGYDEKLKGKLIEVFRSHNPIRLKSKG